VCRTEVRKVCAGRHTHCLLINQNLTMMREKRDEIMVHRGHVQHQMHLIMTWNDFSKWLVWCTNFVSFACLGQSCPKSCDHSKSRLDQHKIIHNIFLTTPSGSKLVDIILVHHSILCIVLLYRKVLIWYCSRVVASDLSVVSHVSNTVGCEETLPRMHQIQLED